jgi:hypothetical protein
MTAARGDDMHALALHKLTNVLGPEQAHVIMRETLQRLGVARLDTPDDLYRFAQQVSARGGFAGAVGSLLGVMAVVRGASIPGA